MTKQFKINTSISAAILEMWEWFEANPHCIYIRSWVDKSILVAEYQSVN